ncbi:hypothetical protein EC988_001979 [Linderina pennispora]|nr:hypothetical protein EC988_001979 [Linderina pennispora]
MAISQSVVEEETKWVTANGYEFYTRLFKSVVQPPKATLLLMHALGDRVDNYTEMAQYFAHVGIQFFGFDQRGFGKSGSKAGDLGDNGGVDSVVKDIAAMNRLAMIDGVKHFMLGISMGGMYVLNYCLLYNQDGHIAGIISDAPALKTLGVLIPSNEEVKSCEEDSASRKIKKTCGFKPETLFNNKAIVERWERDDLSLNYSALGTLVDIHTVGPRIAARASDFITPVLLAHADGDSITDPNATRKFFADLPDSLDKKLKIIENCPFHVITGVVGHELELVDEYTQWILSRVERDS